VVPTDEVVAQTKNGKQVLSVPEGVEAVVATLLPENGDMVAVVGENRKLLLFPLSEVPEMNRGRGVTLQKYKDGGLSDARVYAKREGLTWKLGERPAPRPTSNSGSANAPKPAASRPMGSRRITSSGEIESAEVPMLARCEGRGVAPSG
jgi:topoisomerase-4 subunit A